MSMVKKYWADISKEPISEEAIRTLHTPQKAYKFYLSTVEAGKHFPTKASHEFTLYILAGSCTTLLDGIALTLSASEFISLEKGSYEFDVTGNSELKVLKVFSFA